MLTVDVKINPAAILGAEQAIDRAGRRVRPHTVTFGIHEDEGSEPKLDYKGRPTAETVAEAMMAHEFGTDVLPERSWLRRWFDANAARLQAAMDEAMRRELGGDRDAVRKWALAFYREWMGWIADGGDFTGLMPETIIQKARASLAKPDVPLVATGQFLESIGVYVDGRNAK